MLEIITLISFQVEVYRYLCQASYAVISISVSVRIGVCIGVCIRMCIIGLRLR